MYKAIISKLILLCCLGFSGNIYSELPDLGDESAALFTPKTEIRIGEYLMQRLRRSETMLQDPIIDNYLNYLGNKLTTFAKKKISKFEFFCINSKEINAFAFFGGNVAIHSGLILATNNEHELAAVMAHEISHITQHHLARLIADNQRMIPLTIAQAVGAIVLGSLGQRPDAGVSTAAALFGQHQLNMMSYNRDYEREADRIGINMLARAGFDPSSMAAIFQAMQQGVNQLTNSPEYLQTHPLFPSRIADATNRASLLGYKQYTSSDLYNFIKSRLQVIAGKKPSAFFAQDPTSAGRYGYALALMREKKFKLATTIAAKIPMKNLLLIKILPAEIFFQAKNYSNSIVVLKKLAENHPNNPAIEMLHAKSLVKLRHAKMAKQVILNIINHDAKNWQAYDLLGKSNSMLGNRIATHQALAEKYKLLGDFPAALQQLAIALEFTGTDKILKARIEHQRKQLLELRAMQQEL